MICGTPKSVLPKIKTLLEVLASGNLHDLAE